MKRLQLFSLLGAVLLFTGCSTLSNFGPGKTGSTQVSQGITVGNGFQATYIASCVTTSVPYCATVKANACKASAIWNKTVTDGVATFEKTGDYDAFYAQLLADANDLQAILNGPKGLRAHDPRKSLDPLTWITIAEYAFQIGSQVYQSFTHPDGSQAALDALVATAQSQDAAIQATCG